MNFAAALPHGPITPVVDGVYAVRCGFQMGPGVRISRTMTIVKLGNELVVLNAARLTVPGEVELERLGRVAHLVKLSDSHGLDEPWYVDRHRPEVWTLATTRAERITGTRRLGDEVPIPGARVVTFPGITGWSECGLWIPHGGGTLITTDVLQNHVDTEGTSAIARIITPLMGFKGGLIVASMWRRSQNVQGAALTAALAGLSSLSFENLITGHGPAIIGGADVAARQAIALAAG